MQVTHTCIQNFVKHGKRRGGGVSVRRFRRSSVEDLPILQGFPQSLAPDNSLSLDRERLAYDLTRAFPMGRWRYALQRVRRAAGSSGSVFPVDVKSNVHPNDKRPYSGRYQASLDNLSPFTTHGRLLVNVDWLTLRIRDSLSNFDWDASQIQTVGPYRLQLAEHATPFFKKLCYVFFQDQKIAEIQFSARVAHMGEIALIKYENYIFYDEKLASSATRSSLFSGFFDAVGSFVMGVTRLDVCVDGVDFTDFIEAYRKGVYLKLKSRNLSVTYKDRVGLDFFTVGTRGGTKYARCYRKKTEIKEKGGKKDYIFAWWKKNGIDYQLPGEVWRFEIELSADALKDIEGFVFHDSPGGGSFFDIHNLLSIFEFQMRHFFEFVPARHSDSVISRRPRVQLFYFHYFQTQFVRVKRQTVEGTRTARIIVKRHLRDAAASGPGHQAYTAFTAAMSVIESYALHEWITHRSYFIYDDIRKWCEARGISPFLSADIVNFIKENSLSFE